MVKTLDIFTDAAVTGADIGIGILTDENNEVLTTDTDLFLA
jgi:hypothetical protein